MNIFACIVVGILAGWLAERITGRNRGLLMSLIISGFLTSSLLGFHYAEAFNLPCILVATLGAVILLAFFGGFQNGRVSWLLAGQSPHPQLKAGSPVQGA